MKNSKDTIYLLMSQLIHISDSLVMLPSVK